MEIFALATSKPKIDYKEASKRPALGWIDVIAYTFVYSFQNSIKFIELRKTQAIQKKMNIKTKM